MICTKVAACVKKEMAGRKIEICDNKAEQCVQSSNRRTLVKCEEKRKKYTFENTLKNHIISYKMDGGIIRTDSRVPEGTNKCDYLYVVNSEGLIAILIELKGENVSKALKQIYASLMQYKDVFDQFAHVYGRAVVVSSTPNLKASPTFVNLVTLLEKTYKGNIKIVERQFTEKDVDLGKHNN